MKTFLNEDEEKFYPTVEWMKTNYDKMNNELFDGMLSQCDFGVFTTGEGSEGGVLGWFTVQNAVNYLKETMQMFIKTRFGIEMINRNNFYNYCKPIIKLNGNYKWSEKAMLSTLAHEMCHYYTYMNGILPKRSHGKEFKQIGAYISSKSNGIFTIERLASAEEMSEMELNDLMKNRQNKREENKKIKLNIIFIYRNDGVVEMIPTTSKKLIDKIIDINKSRSRTTKIILSNDINLINTISKIGYDANFRTYRFYPVQGKDFTNNIDNYNIDVIYGVGSNGNSKYENDLKTRIIAKKSLLTNILKELRTFSSELTQEMARNVDYDEEDCFYYFKDFKIKIMGMTVNVKSKTAKGYSTRSYIENDNLIMELPYCMYVNQELANDLSSYYDGEYIEQSENRIATMVYSALKNEIDKLNNKTMNEIIKKEINKFMLKEFNMNNDEIGKITPNMNLGLESPIEADDY